MFQYLYTLYELIWLLIGLPLLQNNTPLSKIQNNIDGIISQGKLKHRKYIQINNDNIICIRRPFKCIKEHIITNWDKVYDMFNEDVTDIVMYFATSKKHFMYSDISPADIIFYDTYLRFTTNNDNMTWTVSYNTSILSILNDYKHIKS